MLIGIPKETKEGERRVSLTPDVAKSLINAGYSVQVESGAGEGASFSDDDYKNAGANIVDKDKVYSSSQVVMKVNNASAAELGLMKKDAVYMSLMFASANREIVAAGASAGISMFSMDAIPRISRAQKMDVLSSQSNLAGYKTVMLGAHYLGKIFPMLMTAAGTIKPSRVVIMGAGVAGLQAIATAKRLGAIVEVSDIRPETKEQVESLGGKYIEVKGDASVKTGGGYVTSVSDEFLKMQQELLFKHITQADLVITTALIPGKKAPVLVTEDMVKNMRPGSVIVDMAVEQGGNCPLSEVNKVVVKHGVTIVGEANLPSLLPMNASDLYAKNIQAFLLHLSTKDGFKWEMDEEITKGSLIVHQGKIVHPSVA
ncbi:MAG: Re/Si-specific NAD(P)(+) transhydrogenase subunit alpha [Bacteroidetes bacterium]|nr:Re/Si-specific NAD(P)(+) transhydrogenase subunit alpha [Bacteroidota bacterium]MBL0052818.1 Re/Si-specific NAD(P)(+) transhydrogenase subunit alpha [Bacteroidota bacterium]